MKGKRKRLTNSQSELVATYLPKKIQKDRKISTSVKLVLANIYQLHYLQKNWGKRTVFCSLDKFIKDIEAKDKNEVVRPQAYLMANDIVYIKSGARGRATEYTLNDELYELLPSMFKGELGDNFKKINEDNTLNNSQLEVENQEIIVPSHNSVIDSELQHLNVHSDSDADTDIKNTQCTIVHVPEDKNENTMNDMKYNDEFITENDRDAWEVLSMEDDFDYTQYEDIAEMVKRDAGSSKYNENKNKSMYDERNAWITRLFERLESTLNLLSQCYDKSLVAGKDGYGDTLNRLFNSGDSKIEAGWFTEKQLYKYQGYINRYNGLMKDRRERFGVKDKTASNAMTVSNENSIISDIKSESDEGGGCAAPQFTEEKYMDALNEVFKDWNLFIYCGQVGYGLYDYRKKVADILGTDIVNINESKFERDVKGMFIPITANEPMVAYG